MSPAQESHRLFFALWPDAATRERLQAAADAWLADKPPKSRRIARERLHLTLHFLGTFAERPQALIERALAAGGDVRSGPFALDIDTCGGFGQRIGWLGPREHPPGMMHLRERLGRALAAHDVPLPEAGREWKPHVSVLRGPHRPPPERVALAVHWPVSDFVLVHSGPGDGRRYTVLRQFPLRAG